MTKKIPVLLEVKLTPAELSMFVNTLQSGLESDSFNPNPDNTPAGAVKAWRAGRATYVADMKAIKKEHGGGFTVQQSKSIIRQNDQAAALLDRLGPALDQWAALLA